MNQLEIGNFINELRKEKNMTQEDLANRMGVTAKSVSRWENGKTLPDISLLVELAEILNITLTELLKGRKLSKDELIKQKGLIDNLLKYDKTRKNEKNKKAMAKLWIGIFITVLALLNNHFPYLNLIFKENAADFFHGFMVGIGASLELIGVYNIAHNFAIEERKNKLLNR